MLCCVVVSCVCLAVCCIALRYLAMSRLAFFLSRLEFYCDSASFIVGVHLVSPSLPAMVYAKHLEESAAQSLMEQTKSQVPVSIYHLQTRVVLAWLVPAVSCFHLCISLDMEMRTRQIVRTVVQS
jgi:hypothetical protein